MLLLKRFLLREPGGWPSAGLGWAVPPAVPRFPALAELSPAGAARGAARAGAGGEGSARLSLKCQILVAAVWGEESASPLTCAAAL